MTAASSVKGDDFCNDCMNHCLDLTFGFNDSRFSDRELIIEILADDEATHQSQTQSSDLKSAEKGVESSCSGESSRFMKFHICSLLLVAKSPFFHNLFTNGMMETGQKCVTLRIHDAEETAVMELLKYMYNGALTVKSATDLLDVLKLADKFQVVSCMKLCAKKLLKLPMSTETALLYLTSGLRMIDEVQLLVDAAKKFLQSQYKDIDKSWKEIMEIPLAGFEVILSGDVLQVASEDRIFDLALKWTEAHYPKQEDQRKILSANLGRYIRFPYMSAEKLREVLRCNILDGDFASKVVIDALFFKIKSPHQQNSKKARMEDSASSTNHRPYVKRAYRVLPIEVHECESPCRDIVVYLNPTYDQCANLKGSESLCSATFDFRGHELYLYARCSTRGWETYFSIGVGFKMHNSVQLALDYEFSSRSESSKKFVQKKSGSLSFRGGETSELYEGRWPDSSNIPFISGVLYLEIKLRIT